MGGKKQTKGKSGGLSRPILVVCFAICIGAIGYAFFHFQGSGNGLIGRKLSEPVDRKLPEVELMDASEKDKYEITNAEDLPYVKYLPGPPMGERRERAMGARFRNFYRYDLTLWWDDGSEKGVYSGSIRAGGFSATNTYTTHRFRFRRRDTDEEIAVLEMRDDQHLMLLGPEEGDTETFNSKAYLDTLAEQKFMKEYYEREGVPWLSYYPSTLPVLNLWPADFVGQVHTVRSHIGYFSSETEQSQEPIDFKLKVVSVLPRAILIENLLSPFEIQHIIEMGEKVVKRSSVGSADDGFQSDTRTSENGWLSRKNTHVLNTIYYRLADVLGMRDDQMVEGSGGNLEQLQFVRYLKTQKYDAHHDFGNSGRPNQRFSTLLMYLKNAEEGGGTSFPKAFGGQGISIKPPEGSGVLFYSMRPDGNGDDYSLHSGMPVIKGTKYLCNLWSWSPSY